MRSTAHNCNLGESSGTTATNSGTLSIPWTQVGSEIIDPTNDVSLHLLQATGIGGYGAAQFNFASNVQGEVGLLDFDNLDPTTPFDSRAPLATGGMANPMAPSTTPSQKDEMLLRVGSPSVSFGSSLITSGGGQYRLGASLNNLMSAGAMSSGGTNTHAFVTETIGLQAPTTPTRTTAHALVNFEALEVFTSTLPVAAAAAQVYEQII